MTEETIVPEVKKSVSPLWAIPVLIVLSLLFVIYKSAKTPIEGLLYVGVGLVILVITLYGAVEQFRVPIIILGLAGAVVFIIVIVGGKGWKHYLATRPTPVPFDCTGIQPTQIMPDQQFTTKTGVLTVSITRQFIGQELVAGQVYYPRTDMFVYEYPLECRGYIDNVVAPGLASQGGQMLMSTNPTSTPTVLPSPTATLNPELAPVP